MIPASRFIRFFVWQGAIVLACASFQTVIAGPPVALPPLRGLSEVDGKSVVVQGGFWGKRLKTHLDVTIDHSLNELEKDGHIANFDIAAGVAGGECRGHAAFDSDLYKVLEGAMLTLVHGPDPRLATRVESVVDVHQ